MKCDFHPFQPHLCVLILILLLNFDFFLILFCFVLSSVLIIFPIFHCFDMFYNFATIFYFLLFLCHIFFFNNSEIINYQFKDWVFEGGLHLIYLIHTNTCIYNKDIIHNTLKCFFLLSTYIFYFTLFIYYY